MTQFGRKNRHSGASSRQEGTSFTSHQERVYGQMYRAIEQIGHRLERTEDHRDSLIERLENLESQAEVDSLTGKYYLPVKAGGADYLVNPTPPKWITAASVASIFIAVISLGVVLTKEPTLSAEQIAALQLNPPQFANLTPQSPYWERLDIEKTQDVVQRELAKTNSAVREVSDPLIESILESLEEQPSDANTAFDTANERYIELFEDQETFETAQGFAEVDPQEGNIKSDTLLSEEEPEQKVPEQKVVVKDSVKDFAEIQPAAGLAEEEIVETHSGEIATSVAEEQNQDLALKYETQANEKVQSPVPQEETKQEEEKIEVAAVQTQPTPVPPKVKKRVTQQERFSVKTANIKGIPKTLDPDPNMPEKVKALEARAFEGIPEAQHDLATLYASGSAIPQDFKRAVYWFYQSAEAGIANSHYNLGVMSHQGLGVDVDLSQALFWYKNAAELGHPEALYNLGIAYVEGIGIDQDIERGASYFKRAAFAGVSQAAYNLGVLYESSFMGGIDKDKAKEWYQYAADAGHQDGKTSYARLTGQPLDLNVGSTPVSLANIEPAAGDGSLSDQQLNRVVEIQRYLIEHNLLPGEADGVYGPRTEDAIRSYQKTSGLPITGQPTDDLLNHMRQAIN